jgi:hypothetical protein
MFEPPVCCIALVFGGVCLVFALFVEPTFELAFAFAFALAFALVEVEAGGGKRF